MNDDQEYYGVLVFAAIIYVSFGLFGLDLFAENVFLGGILLFLGGLIPNIDTHKGAKGGDLVGLVAASAPLIVSRFFPELAQGGTARMVFAIIVTYVAVRFLLLNIISSLTSPRGMLHSLPAAIIAGQLVYLLFFDLYWKDRLFLGAGVAMGMLTHLALDSVGDVSGKSKGKPALKVVTPNGFSTLLLYGLIGVLGWAVISDVPSHARPSVASARARLR